MRKKSRKKRKILTLFGVITVLVLLGAGSAYIGYVYNSTKAWDGLIYPGVKVENQDFGGKTKEEAIKLLDAEYGNAILQKKVKITAGSKIYYIDFSRLNARYNISSVVDQAMAYGKYMQLFKKYEIIKSPVEKKYTLRFTYDDNYIKEVIGNMEKGINKDPVDASIVMTTSGKFEVTPDIKGYKLESDKLEKEILGKINGEIGGEINIAATIDELTAAKTKDKLLSVNTKISTFSTNFSTSSIERATNIELAVKSINGKLLMPGEEFTFNGIVGERTAARGYKSAPVIIGNKVESGLGGGICQVSSTLYNAALLANLNFTERVHHTLPSSYVKLGLDATVDWGNIDYKFKNTLDFPIYIEGYSENRTLVFNIYSDSSLTGKTYKLTNEVYQTIPATDKIVNDPSLPAGKLVRVQKPSTGYKVKVYRSTYENGQLIKTEQISNDYYKPVNGTVRKGTKK